MQEEFSFVSLLLITGLAVTVPILSSRFRRLNIPIIVGEIIAGIIVGKSGFNWIEQSVPLEFLTLFGFTYLMFLSGLEVDFTAITTAGKTEKEKHLLKNPIFLGVTVFAVTLVIAIAVSVGLMQLGLIQEPFMIALILSTTSLGIVVPVLKERGMMATQFGQALLLSALVADFGTLVLITVNVTIISEGLTLDVLLVLLLLIVFALAARAGKVVARVPGVGRLISELSSATAQIEVRIAFALMVAFIVLSEWLGAELILGAFLAGALISLLSKKEGSDLHLKLDAIGFGFFIPIFFIMVGVQFDLPTLLNSREGLLLVPLLLAAAYFIKFVAALLFRFNFGWRETIAAGGLLSARLSLIIAAAAIALQLGAITEAVNSAIILVAIVTCTASPLIFNRVLPQKEKLRRRGVLMVGLGEPTAMLAERLQQTGETVSIVGKDAARAEQLQKRGFSVLVAGQIDDSVLKKAGAERVKTVLAVSSYDEVNVRVAKMAMQIFAVPSVIALIRDAEIANALEPFGVQVIRPQLATVLALEGALHFPAAFKMLTDPSDGVEVREISLENQAFIGKPLREVQLAGDALLLGLRRGNEVLVPHGNTRLRRGDLLMLVGHEDALQEAMRQFNPMGE